EQARKFFLQSGLPPSVLAEIWYWFCAHDGWNKLCYVDSSFHGVPWTLTFDTHGWPHPNGSYDSRAEPTNCLNPHKAYDAHCGEHCTAQWHHGNAPTDACWRFDHRCV
ncbi:hypothetical protein GOODEAATRI_003272, partial [Goodea atripinnis]